MSRATCSFTCKNVASICLRSSGVSMPSDWNSAVYLLENRDVVRTFHALNPARAQWLDLDRGQDSRRNTRTLSMR
jgi:hypothetical protein